MRALLSERTGTAEDLVLREVAEPSPGVGEVRVRVEACGLNYPDILMIVDKYQFRFERPFAPGIEICGIVEALGPDAQGLTEGQRVVVQIDHGGLAEKALARAQRCLPLPAGVAPELAAGSLLTYATSYHALRDRAALKPGETLLVLGASGGVGLAAVQLGKLMGATVVAAASSQEKADAALAAGADRALVYPQDHIDERQLAAAFKAACPAGCDVVYDPIGGDYTTAALRGMNWNGRYLVVGFAGGIPHPSLNLVLLKGCQIMGVFWGAAAERDPAMARATTAELFEMIADGRLRPPQPHLYRLEDAAAAIAALRDRKAIGKLVVMTS